MNGGVASLSEPGLLPLVVVAPPLLLLDMRLPCAARLVLDNNSSLEWADLTFGLLGPRTLPSLAYSQMRPLFVHRLQDGCSPLHWDGSKGGGEGK